MIQTGNYHIKLNKVIAFVLTVIFLAVACSLALISGSHSLTNTYDAGEVCDVRNGSTNIVLDPTGDNNYFWAATSEAPFAWNYFYINITDASFEEAAFTVKSFYGGEVVGDDIDCIFENGFNEIRLSGEKCDSLQIIVTGDGPVSFTARVMEFRENKTFFSMSRYLLYVAGLASLFALVGGVFIWWMRKKRYRIDWYAPIDFLQDVYIAFGNRLTGVSSKVPYRVKHVLRVAALICWLFWIMMMYNTGKYVRLAVLHNDVALCHKPSGKAVNKERLEYTPCPCVVLAQHMHVRFGILHKQEILHDWVCEFHCIRILLFRAEQSQGKKACSTGDNDVLQAGVFDLLFIHTGSAAKGSTLRPHGTYVESQYIWDILWDSSSGVFSGHKEPHDTEKIWRQIRCKCSGSYGVAILCDAGRFQGGDIADCPGSDLFHGGIHLDNEEGNCETA